MLKLTSRQRVREALEHREVDRVPIDFAGTRTSGISAIAYNNLKKFLGIESIHPTKVYDVFMQLADPDLNLIEMMGGDVIQLPRLKQVFGIKIDQYKPGRLPDGSECLVPCDFNPVQNKDGDFEIWNGGRVIGKRPQNGLYFDRVWNAYGNVQTTNDIDKIPLDEMTPEELDYLKGKAKELSENTDYAITGEFGGYIFETGQVDWGYERYLTEIAANQDLINYYNHRLTEQHLMNLKKYLDAVGRYIDVIQFGDDLGSQESSQISVKMYREMIKPYHAKLYQYVRNNYPRIKVYMHCCGAIYDLIPDLLEAGVQILNPVQLSAKKMDPRQLKNEFGKDLVFWGGGCNLQTTATFGNVDDIKNEVRQLIKIFSPGGGFIFTQIHNIQANISAEKIMTIYNTAKESCI